MPGQRAAAQCGMKTFLTLIIIAALAGCHQEGPAEKAGRQVDEAGKAAARSIEKAGDSIRDAAKGKN
jgi:predicted small lipoprotein YifL